MSGNDHDPQFRDIADHLGAILWISDPDGERMLFCSQAYETMWGRPVAELYTDAESWMEGVHPDDRERMLAAWDRRWTGYDVEYRVIRPDGTTVHVGLVAEDEPLVRTLVADALREQGYTVLEAGDGEEALAIADATPGLTLLVTDVVMPAMDGRELATRLRDREPGIPVLFVSGYTDGALADDGEPATAFLPKPFVSAELTAAVRTLLDPEPSPA